MKSKSQTFFAGCKAGLPIAIGYLSISITFGVLSTAAGLHVFEATAMSALVYAGASQFIAVSLLGTTGWLEVVFATFVLNLRHLLMSTTLALRLDTSRSKATFLSFGITDETFVVSTVGHQSGRLQGSYFAGIAGIAYLSWVSGTVIGALFGTFIPQSIASSLGIALYAMFIALLTPAIKASSRNLLIATSSAGLCTLLYYLTPQLSQGWAIVISTMFAASLGTLFSPVGNSSTSTHQKEGG